MSRMIVCDYCAQRLPEQASFVEVTMMPSGTRQTYDICNKCYWQLFNQLETNFTAMRRSERGYYSLSELGPEK